jgi:hypothetical protein
VLNSTSRILTYKITFFFAKDCREQEIKKNSTIGPIKHGLISVPVPVPARLWSSVFSSSSSKIVDLSSGHPENHALVSILVPAGFWTLGAVTQKPVENQPAEFWTWDPATSSPATQKPESCIWVQLPPETRQGTSQQDLGPWVLHLLRNGTANRPAGLQSLGLVTQKLHKTQHSTWTACCQYAY